MLRIDVVTIFPGVPRPAASCPCSARPGRTGLLELAVHDLRDFTPTGTAPSTTRRPAAEPGMVMRPEPWGEALDARPGRRPRGAGRRRTPSPPCWCPSPSGRAVRPGAWRASWPASRWLVFACGRYEGIDERVCEDAATGDAGAAGQPRRLRAERRRGGRAGDRRGGRRGCCPACSATPRAWSRRATRTGCWSTRSTPSRRAGAAATCRRCCCPGTTPRSPAGAATSGCAAPRSAGPDLLAALDPAGWTAHDLAVLAERRLAARSTGRDFGAARPLWQTDQLVPPAGRAPATGGMRVGPTADSVTGSTCARPDPRLNLRG